MLWCARCSEKSLHKVELESSFQVNDRAESESFKEGKWGGEILKVKHSKTPSFFCGLPFCGGCQEETKAAGNS